MEAGINSQNAPRENIGQAPVAETHTPLVSSLFAGFGKRLALVFTVLLVLVSAVLWRVIRQGQNHVIEYQAREVAEVVAQLAMSCALPTYGRLPKNCMLTALEPAPTTCNTMALSPSRAVLEDVRATCGG